MRTPSGGGLVLYVRVVVPRHARKTEVLTRFEFKIWGIVLAPRRYVAMQYEAATA
jgi:hypothetical protein